MRAATLSRNPFRYRGTRSGAPRRLWIRLKLNIQRYAQLGTSTTSITGLIGAVSAMLGLCAFGVRFVSDLLDKAFDSLRPVERELFENSHTQMQHLQSWVGRLRHRCAEALHRQALRPKDRTAPVLAVATATVLVFSLLFFGLGIEVKLDGKTIGYLESASQLQQVVSGVEAKASEYLGVPYHYGGNLSYSLVYLRNRSTSEAEEMASLLFSTIDHLEKTYALKIDGQVIATNKSRTALQMMLNRILSLTTTSLGPAKTEFLQSVEIVPSSLDSRYEMSIPALEAMLSQSKQETKYYTVVKGDNVSKIANKHDMTVSQLKALNPGKNLNKIYVGDKITVSAAVPYLSVKQTITQTYSEDVAYGTTIEYTSTMYSGISKIKTPGVKGSATIIADVVYVNGQEEGRTILSYEVTKQPKNEVKLVGTKARPLTMATGTFIKPTSGSKSAGYGRYPTLSGTHTDVDWANKVGTNIYAADGGKVIYAGVKGNYGYLVIIDHENGFQTYYAHCSKLLVKKGERVYQGQHIAEMGATGRVTGPHLHFEVRINGQHKDPLKYVGKKYE